MKFATSKNGRMDVSYVFQRNFLRRKSTEFDKQTNVNSISVSKMKSSVLSSVFSSAGKSLAKLETSGNFSMTVFKKRLARTDDTLQLHHCSSG